jgi:hypothetical protein
MLNDTNSFNLLFGIIFLEWGGVVLPEYLHIRCI